MNRKLALKILDSYKRKHFLKIELKNKYLRFKKIKYVNKIESEALIFYKKNLSNTYKRTKLNNKCLVSGRNYNVSNHNKLSRFEIRNNFKTNSLAGFIKR